MARKGRKENPLVPIVEIVKPERIYHVGEYVRLSVQDSGKGTSDSIENQKAMIHDYVDARPDMELYDTYCDNGESGVSFDRPEFDRLMGDVKSGRVDCIVVKDLSRFGRNYIETGNYLERVFPFLKVRFVAITDDFDTLSAERSEDGYMVPLKNLINSIYAKDISQKSGSALAAKQRNGDFLGSWAAYGYYKDPADKNSILVDDEAAQIVRDIFKWYSDGLSIPAIVRKLKALSIPSPSTYRYKKGVVMNKRFADVPWRARTIKLMLENEVYLGHMVQGRKRESLFEGQKQKMLPKEDWTIVRNTHEAIVEQPLFSEVQGRMQKASARYKSRASKPEQAGTSENLLRGLIYCGECGTHLTRYKKIWNNKHKEPKYHICYSYICPFHTAHIDDCSFTGILEKEVIQAVFSTIQEQIACAADSKQILAKLQKQPGFRCQKSQHQAEKEKLEQKLSEVTKYRKGLFENHYAKVINEEDYLRLSQSYEEETKQMQERLAELISVDEGFNMRYSPSNRWITAFEQFSNDSLLTRNMVLTLVKKIVVTQNKEITITLNYRDEYIAVLDAIYACDATEEQVVNTCE